MSVPGGQATHVTIRSARLGGDYPAVWNHHSQSWVVSEPETGRTVCDLYSTLDEALLDLEAVVVE